MEKIQENSEKTKSSKKFLIGVILILVSIVYGWIGLFVCNAFALRYGRSFVILGWVIYGFSWVTYGLGFLLAGREGILYAKKIFRKIRSSK